MNTKSMLVVAIVMTAVISLASGTAQAKLLWGVDPSGTGELVNFDPWTGTEYTRYPLPSISSSDTEIGLAGWEYELFYINGDQNAGHVYVLDPEDGSTITEYDITGGWNVNGLGYASGAPGSYIYTSGCSVGDMHRYIAADGSGPLYYWGNSIQNRNAVGGDHGGRIFTPLAGGVSIAEVDPWVDKDPLNTIPSPSETIVGMAYDGEYLYASDTSNDVYIMNADTGDVVNTIRLGYTLYALGSTEGNPNLPPVANAGPDQTVEQTCYQGADVTLDGSGSSDPDGDPLTYSWTWAGGTDTGMTPTVSLPLGTTTITLTVSDGELTATDTVDVNVVDTTPPVISVTVSPDMLWPPNHKMVDITATVTVSDICDAAPTVVLTSITSDEPDNTHGTPWDADNGASGDGNTNNDIQGDDIGSEDYEFQLRAERCGTEDGRTYTITYTVTDASGNSADASATVVVPHSM
ncbi:MAG: hypothetical protein GQ533_11020 [Methanosarcinaceae archaeon]|nr:hypothetical protein [Methanosarcinaceae archaeon]